MKIRLFKTQDIENIARLFHETVREININDYSTAQVKAWAPDNIYFRNWESICTNRFTYVADDKGIIAGFGELIPDGHIDCFYCHKSYQRCGVGSLIYKAIELKALELGLPSLVAEASITALPFFQKMGFAMIKEQEVVCRGTKFINYLMKKTLSQSV
ncbi:MAG: GNAT family N-acetyltransferase [Pseudomonadota bacterium]